MLYLWVVQQLIQLNIDKVRLHCTATKSAKFLIHKVHSPNQSLPDSYQELQNMWDISRKDYSAQLKKWPLSLNSLWSLK